jgi:hypothetical protein
MRYRLRTLLIVLALGPPVIAARWRDLGPGLELLLGLALIAPLLALVVTTEGMMKSWRNRKS